VTTLPRRRSGVVLIPSSSLWFAACVPWIHAAARIGNIRSNVNDCVVTVTHVCGYVNPCVFTTDPTADITLIQLALDKSVRGWHW
jgi:hypothetical protein